jgi:hypothetical protein
MYGSIKIGKKIIDDVNFEMHRGFIMFPQLFGETYRVLPEHIVKITKTNIIFTMKIKKSV